MISDPTFATPTMARIQAAQGNLGAAAAIYRYLLQRQPERADLAQALAEVENRLMSRRARELAGLLERWVGLLTLRHHLARLDALRSVDKSRRLPQGARTYDPPGAPADAGSGKRSAVHRPARQATVALLRVTSRSIP